MVLYLLPGLLHFFTPVNIVEDQDGMFCGMGQQGFKITEGRFEPVVAIHKGQFNRGMSCQYLWQGMIKITGHQFYIRNGQLPEVGSRLFGYGTTPLPVMSLAAGLANAM